MRTLMKRLNARCTTAAARLRSIFHPLPHHSAAWDFFLLLKKKCVFGSWEFACMSVSTNITRRTAALAVLGVLLLGAGHNAQGAKSTTRKGGGGNAKGGELKAKLAANEV
jgi:hypothetical protein